MPDLTTTDPLADAAYDALAKADAWAGEDDPDSQDPAGMAAALLSDAAVALAMLTLDHLGYDTSSSASRQHYIDTGCYLRADEVREAQRAELSAQLEQTYKSMGYAAERNDGTAYQRLKDVARDLRERLASGA